MTRDEIKLVVNETLSSIGFDVENPHKMQADMAWVRRKRELSNKLQAGGMGAFITALIVYFWDEIARLVGK